MLPGIKLCESSGRGLSTLANVMLMSGTPSLQYCATRRPNIHFLLHTAGSTFEQPETGENFQASAFLSGSEQYPG